MVGEIDLHYWILRGGWVDGIGWVIGGGETHTGERTSRSMRILTLHIFRRQNHHLPILHSQHILDPFLLLRVGRSEDVTFRINR